jgi:hypothetical protein
MHILILQMPRSARCVYRRASMCSCKTSNSSCACERTSTELEAVEWGGLALHAANAGCGRWCDAAGCAEVSQLTVDQQASEGGGKTAEIEFDEAELQGRRVLAFVCELK